MISRCLSIAGMGAFTGFAAALLGWQVNLVAIHRGIARGRRAAFLVGLGASLADLLFTVLAFLGAAPLLRHAPIAPWLKWPAVAVMLYAAIRIFWQDPKRATEEEKHPPSHESLLLGFLFVASNPLVLLAWFGVISILVSHLPDLGVIGLRWLFLGMFLVGTSIWFGILSRILLPLVENWSEERLRLLSKIGASAMLIAVLVLICERL